MYENLNFENEQINQFFNYSGRSRVLVVGERAQISVKDLVRRGLNPYGECEGDLIWKFKEKETCNVHYSVVVTSDIKQKVVFRHREIVDGNGTIQVLNQYDVFLEETDNNYGGIRLWFICPICNKTKCSKLNLGYYNTFCCRKCGDFRYSSQVLSKRQRRHTPFYYVKKVDEAAELAKRNFYGNKITKNLARYIKYKNLLDKSMGKF